MTTVDWLIQGPITHTAYMQVESTSLVLPEVIGDLQRVEVGLAPEAPPGSSWHLHYVAVLSDDRQDGSASPQSIKSLHHPQLEYFPAMRWLADFRGDRKAQETLSVSMSIR